MISFQASDTFDPITLALEDVHSSIDIFKAVQCSLDGCPQLTVYFDKFSGGSGNQRAFIDCPLKNDEHAPECRKYVTVNHFATRDECVACLYCWGVATMVDAMSRNDHQVFMPDADQIEDMRQHLSE